MPRLTGPLPDHLNLAGFTVRQAHAAGVTSGRLRGTDLVVVTSGMRGESGASNLIEAAAAFALVLPAPWAFSHLTAARLLDLPLRTEWSVDEPLHLVRPTELAMLRRTGVVHHRGLESRAVIVRHGLPVVAHADTWCDLAGGLSPRELVVVGDAVVNDWTGRPSAELDVAVSRRSGCPGVRAARAALALVRTRSRSPMETVARLEFADAGLPEPELNADVFDENGGWLTNSDFVWRERRTLAEYDGDQHRTDQRRWRSDHRRRRELTGAGWRVHTLTADDFANPAATRRCIADITRDLDRP